MRRMTEHPLVGGWLWDNDPAHPGTNISYALFHPDGTYLEFGQNGSDLGVWQATGERTANLTLFFANVDPDPDVVKPGEGRLAVEVDETGNAITAPFAIEARTAGGTIIFAGELLALATRPEGAALGVPNGTIAATSAA